MTKIPHMPLEQVFIGGATAVLCLAGLRNDHWFLEHTRKGRRLVHWFGEVRALWVLRVLLACGLALGVLLALGILNPVRW